VTKQSHSAAYAEGFYIGNLLFVGLFYVLLWILFTLKYKQANAVAQSHIKQTLILSSITSSIFLLINIIIMLTTGYASAPALIILEVYYMLIAPVFLALGIFGFMRATKQQEYCYPMIGKKCLP